MKAHSPQPHLVLLAVATAVACLLSACVWDPWIPGQSKWNPEIVVDPANILQQLALDAPYVDDLNCYARRCQKRFRLVVDRPGQLTVTAVLELTSEDQQVRIVLEATQGVLAQDGTGRGVRTDVSTISVGSEVEAGTYFVLLQSLGGRIPYELTATLTPSGDPATPPEPEPAIQIAPLPPDRQPLRFTEVDLGFERRRRLRPDRDLLRPQHVHLSSPVPTRGPGAGRNPSRDAARPPDPPFSGRGPGAEGLPAGDRGRGGRPRGRLRHGPEVREPSP